MKKIILITSSSCKDCEKMRNIIKNTIKTINANIIVEEFDSETNEAIDMAIKYNIMDIPGCYINGKSIYGKNFNEVDIINNIKIMSL